MSLRVVFRFDIKHITEDSDLQPCLVLFDLLYLNGKRLTSMPQCERALKLREIIRPLEGRIQLAEVKQVSQNQEVSNHFYERSDCKLKEDFISNFIVVFLQ